MNKKVGIVVLNWNMYEDTKRCLESLFLITYPNYEIILVDNGSKDGSIEKLEKEYGSRVKIIKNHKNLGFSGGNNVGIRYALESGCDYVLLLNPDTEVEPNFLETLVEVMESDKEVGAVQPVMLEMDNKDYINSLGIEISVIGNPFDISRHKPLSHETNYTLKEVFGVCAGAGLYRGKALIQVGLLDETYFITHEDVDLAWRLRLKGYKAMVVLKSRIFHKGGVTLKKSGIRGILIRRNRLFNVLRYYPWWLILFYLPFHLVSTLKHVRLCKHFFKGITESILMRKYAMRNKNIKEIYKRWLGKREGYITLLKALWWRLTGKWIRD